MNDNNKGFTLIEILVAITVLSLLMVSVYNLVDSSSRTKDQILAEDKVYLQIHSALDRFALDWSQLYTPLYHAVPYKGTNPNDSYQDNYSNESEQGKTKKGPKRQTVQIKYEPTDLFPLVTSKEHLVPTIDDPKRGEIVFMTTSGRRVFENSKQSRYIWVKYFLRPSTADPEDIDERAKEAPLELARSTIKSNIYRKEFDWDSVKSYVLLRGIKELRFLFWNRDTKKYVESLRELNNQKNTPRIMKIKLTVLNSSGVEEVIERSYKPIWPFFDTKAAEEEKNKKDKTKRSSGKKRE